MIQKQNATPDLFPESEKPVEIIPARKLSAKVAALYVAPSDHFQRRPVEALQLGFEGIAGDFHAGATRRSGGLCVERTLRSRCSVRPTTK